jgi:general secretion pathway protein A
MLLNYYTLAEQPFGVTPDSRFLYLGPKHREALASLIYGTESNRGFLALIAKPGMGKTSLLYHYLAYLRDKARTAFIFRTDCDSREFIRHLLLDLGIDAAGMDLPAMHEALNRMLTEEMRAGRRFVLVIDEAQNLDEKVLESVRLLSNFETPWMKLMQIVLAGQPQLADRLASPSMAQLRQRISMVIRIEPFDAADVNSYIDHRLSVAGCEKPSSVFTAGARNLIAEHSEGIPRNINNLCFNAMSLACATKSKTVDRDIIMNVIDDLDLEPLREKRVVVAPSARVPVVAQSKLAPASIFVAAKGPSSSAGGPAKIAAAAAILVALGLAAAQVHHTESRVAAAPAVSAVTSPVLDAPAVTPDPVNAAVLLPVSTSLRPSMSESTPASAVTPSESVKVTEGQTLYQISVDKFGKYDTAVLEQIRTLNPGISDPNRIHPGQKILVPSAAAISADPQRAAGQPSSAAPAEAGKHE